MYVLKETAFDVIATAFACGRIIRRIFTLSRRVFNADSNRRLYAQLRCHGQPASSGERSSPTLQPTPTCCAVARGVCLPQHCWRWQQSLSCSAEGHAFDWVGSRVERSTGAGRPAEFRRGFGILLVSDARLCYNAASLSGPLSLCEFLAPDLA